MGDDAPSTQEGRLLSVKERAAMLNAKKAASSGPDGGGHVLRSPGVLKRQTSASSHDKKPEAMPPSAPVDASGATPEQDPKPTPPCPDASLPRPAEPLIAPNTYALRKPLAPAPPVSGVSPPEAPPLSASASGSNDPEAPSTAVPVATDTGLPSPLVISSPVCGAPSLDGSGSGGVPSSGPRRRSAGLEQRLAALAGAGGEVPLPFSPAMLRAGGGGGGLPLMGIRSPGPPQVKRLSGSQGQASTKDDSAQGGAPNLSHSTLARPTVARQRRPRTTPTPLPQEHDM